MNPQLRWKRVQQLSEQAEALSPAEREAFLLRQEADTEIRAEAARLIWALSAEPVAQAAAQADAHAGSGAEQNLVHSPLPAQIGQYRVTALLGVGGTGTVYAVEPASPDPASREPAPSLAVKVLHGHLLDNEMVERFQRERRMLTRLHHPGIIRLFDSGVTADQRPYLVMERIAGQKLDDYCDSRSLDTAARVRLIVAACEVVHAAHRALVVHLDLKPSNILVTPDGSVKLLDFGTAKLMDPLGALTTTRQLTPLYASPEQLRGDSVTTACDIYTLGLILFELLSGSWPYPSRDSIASLAERASGQTSTRDLASAATPEAARRQGLTLERLRTHLRGDLNGVLLKALAAEPAQRYDTVAAFAEDLTRYLESRPVLAKPQTALYRARKFVARNAAAVGLTAALLVGLFATAAVAVWQQQEKLAAGRRGQATAQFLSWLLQSSNPMYGGKQSMTLQDLIDKADLRLRGGQVLEPALAASLEGTMGNLAYVGGRPEKGLQMVRDSVEWARKSGHTGARLDSLQSLAQMELSAGRCPQAIALIREGETLLPSLDPKVQPAPIVTFLLAQGQIKDGCENNPAAAIALTEKAVSLLRLIPDSSTEMAMPARLYKALVHVGYSMGLTRQKRYQEAHRSVEAGLRLADGVPDSNGVKIALLRSLSTLEYAEGNATGSARALEDAVHIMEGYTSPFEFHRLRVMWAARLAESGEKDRSAQLVDQTIADVRQQTAAIGQARWMIYVDAALAKVRAGHCEGVLDYIAEADAASAGAMPWQWKGNRSGAQGVCLAEAGRKAEARASIDESLELLKNNLNAKSKFRLLLEDARRKAQ